MIPFTSVRTAERRRIIAVIAAEPTPARLLRTVANGSARLELSVRASEPSKVREMRQGGFDPTIELECQIALPLASPRPEAEREFMEVADHSGEFRTYTIGTVKALRGLDCYLLGLKSRKNAPTGQRPVRP